MAKKKQKIYVLDTNILMSDPNCLDVFDDNMIVIPSVVLEELDDHKEDLDEKGYNVRETARKLDELRETGSLAEGVRTERGGVIRTMAEYGNVQLPKGWKDKPDNGILRTAKYLSETEKAPVILVTNDTWLRIKADTVGVKTEGYRHEKIDEDFIVYNGRGEAFVSHEDFGAFLSGQPVSAERLSYANSSVDHPVYENQFFMLMDTITMGTKPGIAKNGKIVPLRFVNEAPYGAVPKNTGQRYCVEALLAPAEEIPLVILKGSAGTAKTFLTLACGLERCVNSGDYRKITVTRANVEFDKDIGALPGDEESKVGPLLRGCMDNLELLVDPKGVRDKSAKGGKDEMRAKVNALFESGIISAEALGFLRGRSLTRQYVFVDEAQNTTVSQMKGILTRIGEGSKLVIAGDLNQIDNARLDRHNNGLAYALKMMRGDPLCAIVGFLDKETTRSLLAASVGSKISR
ncbi:MAG: PhoH family protein [Clostridiales bacterium]|nr:PhoH family protein [Clostridiales bacterium]